MGAVILLFLAHSTMVYCRRMCKSNQRDSKREGEGKKQTRLTQINCQDVHLRRKMGCIHRTMENIHRTLGLHTTFAQQNDVQTLYSFKQNSWHFQFKLWFQQFLNTKIGNSCCGISFSFHSLPTKIVGWSVIHLLLALRWSAEVLNPSNFMKLKLNLHIDCFRDWTTHNRKLALVYMFSLWTETCVSWHLCMPDKGASSLFHFQLSYSSNSL